MKIAIIFQCLLRLTQWIARYVRYHLLGMMFVASNPLNNTNTSAYMHAHTYREIETDRIEWSASMRCWKWMLLHRMCILNVSQNRYQSACIHNTSRIILDARPRQFFANKTHFLIYFFLSSVVLCAFFVCVCAFAYQKEGKKNVNQNQFETMQFFFGVHILFCDSLQCSVIIWRSHWSSG